MWVCVCVCVYVCVCVFVFMCVGFIYFLIYKRVGVSRDSVFILASAMFAGSHVKTKASKVGAFNTIVIVIRYAPQVETFQG